MPVFQPITSSTDVPVAATIVAFEPVRLDGPSAFYAGETRPGGVAPAAALPTVLEPSLTMSLRKPSKTSRVSKFQLTLIFPQPSLDATGLPMKTKDREARVDVIVTSSERAVPKERLQVLELALGLLYTDYVRQLAIHNKTVY